MITISSLICIVDRFLALSGDLRESTLSYRIFGDTKKLTALRGDAEITVGRFNAAMRYFAVNWPPGQVLPDELQIYAVANPPTLQEDAT